MNLTTLRHYRRQLEDILRAELSVLEGTLEATIARSSDLEQSADRAADLFQSTLRQGLSRDEMIDRTRDIEHLTVAAQHAVTMVADARERWEQKRAEVIEAARERKTLELLEQRRLQQRMVRLRRLEQHALDEAAHIRFLRSERVGARHES
ncbi:MAG TPA: flagellar FliJ family protein [Nitrospiraceae bacterium]|jgi:flagellar export protein FliJ|nr:flagellar FliJ family protein [Nitrospiraceae bacterium]